jgi:hypothetical protein
MFLHFILTKQICDRIRTILSTLSDLQQLISLCTYISMEQSTSKEDSKRVIRFKITQVFGLQSDLKNIIFLGHFLENTARSHQTTLNHRWPIKGPFLYTEQAGPRNQTI